MIDSIYLPLADKKFHVDFLICSNPDCKSAHFSLSETNNQDNPVNITIDIDTVTWEHKETASHGLAEELFAELLKELFAVIDRNEVTEQINWAKEEQSNLLNYSMSRQKVLDGELIAYSSAATKEKSLYDGGNYYSIECSYQDKQFLVEELYCPKPECHCNEVHFLFFGYDKSVKNKVIPEFKVKWSFSGKIKDIDNLSRNYTKKQIQTIFKSVLNNEDIANKDIIQLHYEQIKAIGKRGLNSAAAGLNIPYKSDKIGRNDPCPCNSGKKYKKCCMNK